MNVAADPAGKVLVTGTRYTFLYRSLDAPAKTTQLPVPMDDIYMRPRSLLVEDPSKIFVKSGSDTLVLDPEGKKPAVVLSRTFSGRAPRTGEFFSVGNGKLKMTPAGLDQHPRETLELPGGWSSHESGLLSVSDDGMWIAFFHNPPGGTSSLAVVDRVGKKVVRDVPVGWTATTLAFSNDGTRLAAGASDRAIYVFDFTKLKNPAN